MASAVDLLVLDDPRFDAHRASGAHPERPERLTAARAALASSGRTTAPVLARAVTRTEAEAIHHAEYVDVLHGLRGKSAQVDGDTFVAPGSVDAAELAAGGLVELVDQLLSGTTTKGLALVRPPGHHARPSGGMGFCLLNNVAIAAAHARRRGVKRVLVLDWDVHHGNGTQDAFFGDPSVLYASTHQFPFYPGTGAALERGSGDGYGYTVNVPLLAGGGDAVYRAAFERVLLPVIEAYAPELVLVSAGFDPALRDPLAGMELSAAAFGWMAASLAKAADASAQGRMALVLEGGYDLPSLEAGLRAAIDGMVDKRAPDIARDADAVDVNRSAMVAKEFWRAVT